MRIKVTRETTLSVKVVLDLEYDQLTRQSSIVAAKIADNNIITPRMVYASMTSGDYAGMDTQAQEEVLASAFFKADEYRKNNQGRFPEEEIRSAPVPLQQWEKLMMRAIGTAVVFPIRIVVDYFARYQVFAEPVICRVPTVYIWEIKPGSGEIEKSMIHASGQLNDPELERTNEGSLRIRWRRSA